MASLVVEQVNRAAKGVARFHFDEICSRVLGPADYFAVANAFRVVVVTDVPDFSLQARPYSLLSVVSHRACLFPGGHHFPDAFCSSWHNPLLIKHACCRCGTAHVVSSPWLM